MWRCCSFFILMAFAGCGSGQLPVYPVSGTVTFEDGQPVRHGTVEFESIEHGTTAIGKIDHSGKFILGTYAQEDGAVAGKHRAIVIQMVIADGSFKHTVDHGRPVPVRYAEYGLANLEFTVEEIDQNELKVVLSADQP